LENGMEQIDHVIVEPQNMVINAFSNFGRQLRVQFHSHSEFSLGISKCSNWLPSERILTKT